MYLKSDTLLSADVFENSRKMYVKIYHFDSVKLLPAPGLACQAALKKLEGGISHAIHRYEKARTNIWKIMIKIKNNYILNIGI